MKINKRKIQYASLSSVFIVFFIVAVILLNIFVGFMSDRFSLSLDLTENNEYSISEATEIILDELDKEINVYIMERELLGQASETSGQVNIIDQVEEMVKRYVTASGGKVKYEFIDKNQNPRFYDKFEKAKATEDKADALIIVSLASNEERYTTILAHEIATAQNGSVFYSTEAELTGAILYVTSDKISKTATIVGHNELDVSLFNSVIEANNFERIDLNLRESNIPEDVNNIIISAPQYDFTADEIAKIDKFLTVPGNNVYVFWNSQLATNLPVLERFLGDWGMQISPTIILDQERRFGDAVLCTIPNNDITSNITRTDETFYTCFSHPIDILWDQKGYTRVLPLAMTMSSSYERTFAQNVDLSLERQQGEDKGPFNIAAVAEKAEYDSEGKVRENKVFLFSSQFMAIDRIMDFPVALNESFFRAMVRYSNQNSNTLSVAPKRVAEYDLNFYESQAVTLGIVLAIVLPLVILAAGIFIFIRRRHR